MSHHRAVHVEYFLEMKTKLFLLTVTLTLPVASGNDGQVKKKPFEETLVQLRQLRSDMTQKYRSLGMMDDFSNIITNMISSLQEVQSKGESMVNKIKTQEGKLDSVISEIEQKEKYIKKVHFEMTQIDEINDRIKTELGGF